VIGLDPATLGRGATERAVTVRQAACRIDDPRQYHDHLLSSPAELQALIEAIVVPESWFFREAAAFTALADFATARYRKQAAVGPLRLLSMPCSSGEEPFSIAITLLEAGLPPSAFQIDAVDVSRHILNRARQGVYGRNSFRGQQCAGHARYFETVADGYRVVDRVRNLVTFKQGNLLDASALRQCAVYDAIFCRNVLIYFDQAAQDSAVGALLRSLAPDGILFVATAETPIVRSRKCAPVYGGHAFKVRSAAVKRPERRPSLARAPIPFRMRNPEQKIEVPEVTPVQVAQTSQDGRLEEAQRLADASRFAEAIAVCDRDVRMHGPSASALHLIGLLRDATGDRRGAADSYRKALYLDPRHEESLVHLALLLEADDQSGEAQRLRARALRASKEREAAL
jgi:chemotaxis protein methyltransferase WspC